jgi:hypothetical protein
LDDKSIKRRKGKKVDYNQSFIQRKKNDTHHNGLDCDTHHKLDTSKRHSAQHNADCHMFDTMAWHGTCFMIREKV